MENVLRGVVGVAYFTLFIHDARHLKKDIQEKNVIKIVEHAFNSVSYISEVALRILLIAGCAYVPVLTVVGGLAAGFGLMGFFIKTIYEYRKERAEEKRLALEQLHAQAEQGQEEELQVI